jgi:hypothetical protein
MAYATLSPILDPMTHGELVPRTLEGDVLESAQVGVGDGADGTEEFAVVLGEVGSGGGVAEEFTEVIDGGGGEQLVELGDVVVFDAVELPEQ